MLSRIYRTELEIRKHQINTLKVFNDNVTEVTEGSEYHVLFNSGGKSLSLIVSLSKDFPNEKPILRVSPVLVHPWVSCDGEITSAPGLLNFTVNSDLGRVVQAIIREFERTPPPLASECTNNINSPTGQIKESENMGRTSPSYLINYLNRHNFSPPSSSSMQVMFTELNTFPIEELQFLNESEIRREEYLDYIPHMQEMNKNLDELISQVEELADSNISKKERLTELRKDIDNRLEEVTKLTFENERLNLTYQTLSEKYTPRNIKNLLKSAAENSESQSENIVQSFLNGEMDVDKFVSLYLTLRTLTQTRKTKEEKLAQQLHSLERAGF